MDKDKRLMEASWWERLKGKLGFVLMGRAMLSKFLIQFYWGCVPSLLLDLRPNYGGGVSELWGTLKSFSPISLMKKPRLKEMKRYIQCHTADCWYAYFSSVQSLSRVRPSVTPWTTACQASLSITNSQSPPKPMSIELVISSNHLILCHPLLLLPSIFPSIRVFSNESVLCILSHVQLFGTPWTVACWVPLGILQARILE